MIQEPEGKALSKEDFPDQAEWIDPLIRAVNALKDGNSSVVASINGQSATAYLDIDIPATYTSAFPKIIANPLASKATHVYATAVIERTDPSQTQTANNQSPQATDWAALTLSGLWVTLNSTAQYRKTADGFGHLTGSIQTGAVPGTIATLPSGFAPSATKSFAVDSNDAHGKLNIYSTGEIYAAVGSSTAFNLDGVKWPIASAGYGGPPRAVFVEWENASSSDGSAKIKIKNVSGLEASTNYRITLKVES